jgi:hypothetical protein
MTTDDLSPEGINKSHGTAVWKCWGCKAETGLHWHNGWSVAMCRKPECAKGFNDMCAAQVAAEEAYLEHCKEIYG